MVCHRYQSLFALSLSLSRLRRDANIPQYDSREVVAWLDSAEPSMVLRVMLDVVMDARLTGRLPESRWVELVSHMINHPFRLLASAVALTSKPDDIMAMQYINSQYGIIVKVGFTTDEEIKANYRTPEVWRKISSVSQDCSRESFWELEDTSPHQEEGVEKDYRYISQRPIPSLPLIPGEGVEKDYPSLPLLAYCSFPTPSCEEVGAAAEKQAFPTPSCEMVLICGALLSEKVIYPMLQADWERRQKFTEGGDVVTLSTLGMSVSASRDRHLKFVTKLLPPQILRVIDCQQSVVKGVVVLIDRHEDIPYTAISHTYGQDVYKVYDCGCATTYVGEGKARANPAETPCNGHHGPDEDKQTRVMNDMLNMCRILVEKGGVHYAWHDGICVAQYDEEDVTDAIMHMGWIYANAEDTVIFLHYAGQPMAPIGTGSDPVPLVARWHTRAWTFQEAVLSKHRRYCVLRGNSSLGSCIDWQDFEDRLALWYVPGQSTIEIVDEADFFHSILLLYTQMEELRKKGIPNSMARDRKVHSWMGCLSSLLGLLESGLFFSVTTAHAFYASSARHSKHPGDHINCILALAGVQEFSVPKDENVEQSTLKFFKRMGKKGLEFAVFTTNVRAPPSLEECSMHRLTWLPSLCGGLSLTASHIQDGGANFKTSQIEFQVLEKNSHIELTGPLVCVPVRFYWKKTEAQSEETQIQFESSSTAVSDVKDNLEQANLCNPLLMFAFTKGKQEEKRNFWSSVSAAKDISELAELHSPDDNLGIFLDRCPGSMGHWLASELRAGGRVLGGAQFPTVHVPPSLLDEDELSKQDLFWYEVMQKFFAQRTQIREALTQCGKHDYRGLMRHCLQEFFDFPTVHTFVQDDRLQRLKMGCFRASLVFPAEALSCNSADNLSLFGFPTLVISGDCIDSPITKIGCFNGSEALQSLLVRKHINFKHLTGLEIC